MGSKTIPSLFMLQKCHAVSVPGHQGFCQFGMGDLWVIEKPLDAPISPNQTQKCPQEGPGMCDDAKQSSQEVPKMHIYAARSFTNIDKVL